MYGYGSTNGGMLAAAARRRAEGTAAPGAPAGAVTPAQSSDLEFGSYGGQVPEAGAFTGKNGARKVLKRMYAQNAVTANQGLWGTIHNLANDANRDWTGYYAEQAAPQLERLHDGLSAAEGNLTRNLASRGLDDSSAMATGLGALGAQGAAATAGLRNTVRNQALDRHDGYRNMLQSVLSGLVNGGMNSASIQNQLEQERLQREQLEAETGFGATLGSLFSGLGGLAGVGAQLGWRPLRPPLGTNGGGSSY